jgi:hypothetical protein
MIADIAKIKQVCCEPIEKIANFVEAINDSRHMWHLHHKLGLSNTVAELKKNDLYFHRPANELEFILAANPGEDAYIDMATSHHNLHATAKDCIKAGFEYKCLLDKLGREQCKDNDIIGNRVAFESWVTSYIVSERIKSRMDSEMLSAATGLTQKFIEDILNE